MEITDVVIILGICFAFCLLILWTYTLGLRNGYKLSKKEEIVLPEVNPVKAVRKEMEIHEQKKEQEAIDIMMSNIDNYDGTGLGQVDIPY